MFYVYVTHAVTVSISTPQATKVYQWRIYEFTRTPLSINPSGKLRSRVLASPDATNDELQALALADAKIIEQIDGK